MDGVAMTRDLERLQFAARNYARLQKLPWAVVGGIMALVGSIQWLSGAAARNLTLPCFVFTYAFVYGTVRKSTNRFYAERYGTVSATAVEISEFARLLRTIGIMAIGVLLVFIIPAYFPSQVDTLWLVVGACLIGAEFRRDFLVHRIAAGMVLLGLSIAPVLHWASSEQLAHGLELIVSGVALVIVGLGDHWVLVHSLPSIEAEESHG
jgi:FtsH-binding integral membrane protein